LAIDSPPSEHRAMTIGARSDATQSRRRGMRISLDPVIANRIDGAVDDLCSSFSGEFDRRQIAGLMDDSVNQLADTAVVLDFLPSLAYRLSASA
jgi:hypothetical protein